MPHIRPESVVYSALRASDAGMSDAQNAALHGVAIKTVRRWRRDYQRRQLPRGQLHCTAPCPRCEGASLDAGAYSELLGWYLGDGYLSSARRGVFNLHIYNDRQYVVANARIQDLMRQVKPGGRPHTRLVPGCVITTVGWKHWPCLFPQHGPGKKSQRRIALEPWQESIAEAHPAELLRGLFHSDGCRPVNAITKRVKGVETRYEYPRWQFTNHSDDIRALCGLALDQADVAWRRSSPVTISVSRRAAVARLDELIGLKR